MPARATRARRFPREVTPPTAGPFVGMLDTDDPSAGRPDFARMLRNVYVPSGAPGQPVRGRPGFELAGTAGSPLGGVGTRTGQWVGQFTLLNGTTQTCAIVGGQFYTYNWGTSTWTETLTAAHFAAATGGAITLSTTARCYAVVLGSVLIVSDGVNTMWSWTGAAGAGLTKLVNAPVAYGPLHVYYSKLAFIKNAARGTFVWSEERDPATGYDVGGYNNAWDFDVTGTAPLTQMAATNEALYIARARSWSRVTGRINDEFETSGTRTDVDGDVGTTSPTLVTGQGVLFVDADGRPHFIAAGGQVVPLWGACATALRAINRTALAAAVLVSYPALDAVLVGLPSSSDTGPSFWLLFRIRPEGSSLIGYWDGWASDTGGLVTNGDGDPVLMVLGDGDGYAYAQGTINGNRWNDVTVSGSTATDTAITHTVTAHPMRATPDLDMTWDRLTWLVRAEAVGPFAVGVRTSRGSSSQSVTLASAGSGSLLGIGTAGSFILSADAQEARVTVGLKQFGRHLEPSLTHSVVGQKFAAVAAQALAYDHGTDPRIP